MKKLLAFFTSKTFFANVLLAIIFFVAIFWLINKGLAVITHHSQRIAVPDLTGLSLSEVKILLEKEDLLFEVIDSNVFDPNKPFGGVLDQYPLAGAEVKQGRVIMLSINPFAAPKIEIPNIIEKTLRRALYDIESKGFVVGKLTYVPDIGKDVVLGIHIGDQAVEPGERFIKGTVLNLTIGAGLSNEPSSVPFLLGLNIEEARLKAQNLCLQYWCNNL
jgi:eukaryotic-like serine/threonine-protein kinase